MFKKISNLSVIVCFFMTTLGPLPKAHADTVLGLPLPGTMVNLSPAYVPFMLSGLTVHPENPLRIDFIVSTGNSHIQKEQVKDESDRLIKYFLACLTIPEDEQWVNLSPYENDRIIPADLGQTALGRDMLAQDYILKQLTASLIYPEKNLGKDFWTKVYSQAQEKFGTSNVPVNTFNKVWILPDISKVYTHNNTVFVVKSHLKVMLDEDYLALQKHSDASVLVPRNDTHSIGANIIRQIILPAIENEVNTGMNFAPLRQIYNSMILSVWYKKNLKEAFLNQVYANKKKIGGVTIQDRAIKEKIYKQYLEAYKRGVFNYIKEDIDQASRQVVPRKYFSGGEAPVTSVGYETPIAAGAALLGDGRFFKDDVSLAMMTPGASPAMNAVLQNVDLRGSQSEIDSWGLINKLAEEKRIAEYALDHGKLRLTAIHFSNYRPGETTPDAYFLGHDFNIDDPEDPHYLNEEQQRNIKDWIENHTNPDAETSLTIHPRLRVVLGDVSLHYKKDIEHSNIIYSDGTDNVLYMGEVLLQHLFLGKTVTGQHSARNQLSAFLMSPHVGQHGGERLDLMRQLDDMTKKLYYDESEKVIAHIVDKLGEKLGIKELDPETKVIFHMMPEDKMGGSTTYINNTNALRQMRTQDGGEVDAVLLPVGGSEKNMFDAQRVLAYIRYNPRILGMIPAQGFKDQVAPYLDDVTPVAQRFGVDPVFKGANGELRGDLDLGRSQYSWLDKVLKIKSGNRKAGSSESGGRLATGIEGSKVLILGGAGVTGFGAAYELIKGTSGRGKAAYVVITDVNEVSLANARRYIKELFNPEEQAKITILNGRKDAEKVNEYIGEADVVFNATGLGKEPKVQEFPPIEYAQARNGQLWVDLNYRPQFTMFLLKAIVHGQNQTTDYDNAVDLSAEINASHLALFLSSTDYGKENNPQSVTREEIDRQTLLAWREALKDSIIHPADLLLPPNELRMIPVHLSDGVPRQYRILAEQYGFRVYKRVERGKIVAWALEYGKDYKVPQLKVASLSIVLGARSSISVEQPGKIRGGEPGELRLEDLTVDGVTEARLGAHNLYENLGLGDKRNFDNLEIVTSDSTSAIATARAQLGELNSILRHTSDAPVPNWDLGKSIDGFRTINSSKKRQDRKIVVYPGIEDRHAGIWQGSTVSKLSQGRLGIAEAEIAQAVLKESDAFGKAAFPIMDGFEPENNVDVIVRAMDLIGRINHDFPGKDVVLYVNGNMAGNLRALIEPGRYQDQPFIEQGDDNMFKRGEPTLIYQAPAAASKAMVILNRVAGSPEGGIDLNAKNMAMESEGEKVDIHFNKAMLAQFEKGDYSGIRFRVLDVTPIDMGLILGLREEDEPLVKA